MPQTIKNNPAKAGQVAGPKSLFGDFHRFACIPVHTRFDAVSWFVLDAETIDELGLPTVIRQEPTKELAMEGLA